MIAESTRADRSVSPGIAGAASDTARILTLFWIGWLACLAVSAAVCRALYADGSYAVLGLLRHPLRYIDYDEHRSFASFIAQTPILLGQRFGVHKVTVYAGLYTIGDYLPPALLFLVALSLARKVPMLFAATTAAIVVFGFGANFINSEANLFIAGAWLATVILALPGRNAFLRGFALPAVAFVLLRVYEGMLLVGPFLALWSFLSAREAADSREQAGLTLATLLFLLGSFIGFSGFVAPRDPGNADNFAVSVLMYLHNPQLFALFAAACGLVAMTRSSSGAQLAWTGSAAAIGAAFIVRMVDLHGYYAYSLYYYNRSFLVCLLPLAVAALFAIHRRHPEWLTKPMGAKAALAAAIPFLAVATADVLGSARWYAYMRTYCDVLEQPAAASTGIARLKDSGAMMGWAWTHPTMSVLLRREGSPAIVFNDPGQWEPVDTRVPIDFPYAGACQSRRFATRGSPVANGIR